MMDYEVFKTVITTRIKDFLPSVYAKFEVDVRMVPKVNGMREAMIVAFDTEGCHMSGPVLYLDELYKQFCECGDIDEILNDAAELIIDFTGTQSMDEEKQFDLKKYKKYVVHMLVNTEMNRELLERVPHKEFLDLSVIYRLAIPDSSGCGYATALITNEMLPELDVTAEKLDELAEENSRQNLKTQTFSMSSDLLMMTTEAKMFGAINLLRMDEIRKIADKMNSNLYLLPSSVHDLMVIRESRRNTEEKMFEMLKEGNDTCNSVDENLSYNMYYYDRSCNKLELRCRNR